MKIMHLHNKQTSIIIAQLDDSVPWIPYLGASLSEQIDLVQFINNTTPMQPSGYLDIHPQLSVFSTEADGLYATPTLRGHSNGEHWCPVFKFTSWNQLQPNHLDILLTSAESALEVTVSLQLDDSGVIAMRNTIKNCSDKAYQLDDFLVSIPVPELAKELLSYTGRWLQEFQPQRSKLIFGSQLFENLRGKTSNDHFPGIVVGTENFREQQGQVMGCHLAWSGNHKIQIEKSQQGYSYILAGAKLSPGEICLETNDQFSTPWLYSAYSENGLTAMSRQFHRFVRKEIIKFPDVNKPRLVHLNTWEAVYFRHDMNELKKLADSAASVGVERFILDDGWFVGRESDNAGLGDWYVDTKKYPDGLSPLITHVNDLGMEFGLWFEPEMINPDSDLYRAHPDWVLQTYSEYQPLARTQYVLDLSKPEVFDYLIERLDSLLTEYNIAYIKWDMNRDLAQASHNGRASVFNQTTKVYDLFDAIRIKHPRVEIESCASGGGRVDYEVLKRTHRFWASDCNDAIERQTIQRNFSMFFPLEVMGAHMGPETCHTTRRVLDSQFRSLTALFGHMGIEAHLNECSEQEIKEFTHAIKLYKKYRDLIHSGDLVRLDSEIQYVATGVVALDGKHALFSLSQINFTDSSLAKPLVLAGLEPEKMYKISTPTIPTDFASRMKKLPLWIINNSGYLSGKHLMTRGLAMPMLDAGSCFLIELEL